MQPDFLDKEHTDDFTIRMFRLFCNLDMINALVAIGLSFWNPAVAFVLLFTKMPVGLLAGLVYRRRMPRRPRRPERRH